MKEGTLLFGREDESGMKFEMYIGCTNKRDSVEEGVYGLDVYLYKDGTPCLRMFDEIEFRVGNEVRKNTRMEALGIYTGIGLFLDYMNVSDYFLEDGVELVVYVKTKNVCKRIVSGSGSLEDSIIFKKLMLRVKKVIDSGCIVRFDNNNKELKRVLAISKKAVSKFPRINDCDVLYSLFRVTVSLYMRQISLDEKVFKITGDMVTARRRYYILDKVGVPLSMGIFNAVME